MGFSSSISQLNNQNPPPPSPNGPSGGGKIGNAINSVADNSQMQRPQVYPSNFGQQGMNGQVTYPGQGGQPQIGRQNPYSQTIGGWDNSQIQPIRQNGKGKGV